MPKPMLDSEVIKDLATCTLTHSIELDDSQDVVRKLIGSRLSPRRWR